MEGDQPDTGPLHVAPFDAFYSLQSLTRSVGTGGDGNYNVGRYRNQRIVVDRVKVEADLPVRNRFLPEGLQISNDTVSHIPLHKQIIPWAMKKSVEVVHRADNRIDGDWSRSTDAALPRRRAACRRRGRRAGTYPQNEACSASISPGPRLNPCSPSSCAASCKP